MRNLPFLYIFQRLKILHRAQYYTEHNYARIFPSLDTQNESRLQKLNTCVEENIDSSRSVGYNFWEQKRNASKLNTNS